MSKIAVFNSKKATIAMFSSIMGFICLKYGLTTEQTALVVSPLLAYIPVQGTIDHQEKRNAAVVIAGPPGPEGPMGMTGPAGRDAEV